MSLKTVSTDYIEKELMKIPDYKATGFDNIPVRYLKLSAKSCILNIGQILTVLWWSCDVVVFLGLANNNRCLFCIHTVVQ